MADLGNALESLPLKRVRTYIQSGNVVFESAARSADSLARRIAGQIDRNWGFRPQVVVIRPEELLAAVQANPFPSAVDEPRRLHFFFLSRPPESADWTAMEQAKAASESYELVSGVLYLDAPDGIARSRLAANMEKYLGVTATARNYRTVEKLQKLAAE